MDIPEEYLNASCPHDYKDAKLMHVAGLVDGKVIMNGENRKSSVNKRASYSDKVNHGGMIVLQYQMRTSGCNSLPTSITPAIACVSLHIPNIRNTSE